MLKTISTLFWVLLNTFLLIKMAIDLLEAYIVPILYTLIYTFYIPDSSIPRFPTNIFSIFQFL